MREKPVEVPLVDILAQSQGQRLRLLEERDIIDQQINNLMVMREAINRRLEVIGSTNLDMIRETFGKNRGKR